MSRITRDICDMLKVPGENRERGAVERGTAGLPPGKPDGHREVPRMQMLNAATNPVRGTVVWSPIKSLWFTTHLSVAVVGGGITASGDAVLIAFLFTVFTLCVGHTIGLHRLLIHRSFDCPKWFEYLLVHLGTVVGMGGPFRMLYLHDIRDWAQRHARCHSFFIHRNPLWKDGLWQLHGDIRLEHPPAFVIEDRVLRDPFHRFLQRTWMLQQLPWAALLYVLGGVGWLVWGMCVRITVSLSGHWLVGYFAHNFGRRDWHVEGHAVQGYNVPFISLLTMGESWHNNHHAFPGSARLGLRATQFDPGWWMLRLFQTIGFVTRLKRPEELPNRPELIPLTVTACRLMRVAHRHRRPNLERNYTLI